MPIVLENHELTRERHSEQAGQFAKGGLQPVHERQGRPVVVVIDDDRAFLELVGKTLQPHSEQWQLRLFNDPQLAWTFISVSRVDAVITDLSMPEVTGFELLSRIRSNPNTNEVPVVILTGAQDGDMKHRALDLGATDLLSKPFHTAELLSRLRSMLQLKAMQDSAKRRNEQLEIDVEQRTLELRQSRLQIIWKLAKAAEFRDEETGEHVVRVARNSARIASQLGLPQQIVDAIYIAAPLHDIGKIGIPDSILLKPGKLTSKEQRIMQFHCQLGFKILSEPSRAEACSSIAAAPHRASEPDPIMKIAQEIALAHHERWDGAGYPNGLSGEAIPLSARIVAVADVYDALRSKRPYKFSVPEEDAMQIIDSERGKHFDPRVVDAFVRCSSSPSA